jgi:hypothetical protein
MMLSNDKARFALSIVPAVVTAATFELFLGHRHDYAGHFLAGYGGTLAAGAVGFQQVVRRPAAVRLTGILPFCAGCILLGAIAETFVFAIAKFDEIDFCNQSLGAVLAAIVLVPLTLLDQAPRLEFNVVLILGIVFLGAGGCFAVA